MKCVVAPHLNPLPASRGEGNVYRQPASARYCLALVLRLHGRAVQSLPSAAQRPHYVRDGRALGAERVDAVELGLEEVALGVDHIELTGEAVLEADAREPQ